MATRRSTKRRTPAEARTGSLTAFSTPIRIPKAAEIVAAEIRRMITRGQLKDGDTLQPEAQIITNFSVSRPTIREAFRILESEKLISISRGSRGGARVHTPRADQVARYAGYVLQTRQASFADVYQARTIIEPAAARYLAEKRSKGASRILRSVIETERATEQTEHFGAVVVKFHIKLIELTENQTLILLSSMLDGIVAHFQSAVYAKRGPATNSRRNYLASLKSQEKLVTLIEAGDGVAAEDHWRVHMENATKVWMSYGDANAVVDWAD